MHIRCRLDGFTLVELVVVLVILGIVAAIGAPRFFDTAAFREAGMRSEVLTALRHGQKKAAASRCWVRVTVNGSVNGGYVAYALDYIDQPAVTPGEGDCYAGATAYLARPAGGLGGGSDYRKTGTDGVALAGSMAFFYDREGRPQGLGGASLAADPEVVVGGRRILVDRWTGLVHEQP